MVMLNDLFVPFNRAIVALLRSPMGTLAGRALMVLEYTGRSSGRRITTPVGYQRDGDAFVVLLTKPHDKTWWKNFREPRPATLLVRRTQVAVTGVLVPPEDPAFFEHVETTLRRLPWMGSQIGGVKFDQATGLTDAQRSVVTEHAAVVRFTPDS
ncbi:MAG: nitroreductase family deazaflavin-dependent oxidoreductase [Microthrixaceae bacterium]|nr:nitroreductase family deazaflavin-dependent oxidoreductase [Microthrixaceae bacterium]